jgi:hypothetical protein
MKKKILSLIFLIAILGNCYSQKLYVWCPDEQDEKRE